LATRLRPGNASSHVRIVPMLLRLVPRLEAAFPGVSIKLRGDASFALPLLHQFCEFFGIQYALGIPANPVFQRRSEPRQKRLARRYRRTEIPQRSFSQFSPARPQLVTPAPDLLQGRAHRHRNLLFLITNCPGRASQVFAFYNDRGECENLIEEFKNGFRATGSAVTAFWPTPSVCYCMASPTTWSTCFARCSFRSRGARLKSKFCAHACSKSAVSCARPPGASASTWPPAGRGNLYSANSPCPLTPANRFLSSTNSSLRS
jgi:hypothetical protein